MSLTVAKPATSISNTKQMYTYSHTTYVFTLDNVMYHTLPDLTTTTTTSTTSTTPPPPPPLLFYGHYTRQSVLAGSPS